ncbi:hypothetical protein ACP70R_045701 [Stipagrostis hirtigluma subsp. patula]
MDRSWMSKVRTSEEYKDGVQEFLSFAFRDIREGGKALCPCVNCANRKTQSYDEVKTHLRCHGILQGYTTWFCHGEQTQSMSSAFSHESEATVNVVSSDNPRITPGQYAQRRLDDMRGLLNAAFVTPDNYDSLSSSSEAESNDESDGGQLGIHDIIGSSPEYENIAAEHDNEGSKEDLLSSFMKDADCKLYSGCETFSKLSFLVTLFHLKCLHGWTRESFTALLGVFSDALPEDAKLPKNYHEAKKNHSRIRAMVSRQRLDIRKGLHIPRWDSKLFNQPKQDLINYVEKKFVYPPETRDFTRDWILKVVSKRWRDYKSFLKKMFYKPNERPMDQIMKNAPPGVNEHQWVALLGIWCQDQHKETKNKGPVHKIDLWDEAHKKKDGNYANQSDKAYDKLAELRRNKNGDLSHEDYDGVFDDVIAKESTAGGYYDDKYWAAVKFCRGPSSVGHSASEVRVQNELQAMRTDLRIVTELAERIRAFIAQKYPEEDWTNTMVNNSGRVGDAAIHGIDHTEESMSNFQASGNDPKQTQVACHAKSRMQFVNASSSCEQRIQKVTKRKELPNQHAVQECPYVTKIWYCDVQYEVDNIEQSCINEALGNNRQKAYAAPHTKAKKHRVNLSPAHEERNVKVSKATELAKQKKSEKQKTVILLSTNVRAQGLVVAKGILVSRDSTYVVGGNMLGKEFYGVTVHHVSELGHERLPRPYGNFQTVEDAIGHCIAWPCTHIKRVKASSARA